MNLLDFVYWIEGNQGFVSVGVFISFGLYGWLKLTTMRGKRKRKPKYYD